METCRFLRPSLSRAIKPKPCPSYSRFFTVSQRSLRTDSSMGLSDYEKRVQLLDRDQGIERCWPRLQPGGKLSSSNKESVTTSVSEVRQRAQQLENDTTDLSVNYAVYGRVKTVRALSSKLVFMVLEQDGHDVQIVCSLSKLDGDTAPNAAKKAFRNTARRGDWFSVVGNLHKTARGEPSLLASELPQMQSPSLHQIPTKLEDDETKARRPHVGMLVDPAEVQTLRIRSRIETLLARWFDDRGFMRVNTPIITFGAGGATARPFVTSATELRLAQLNLRIAPELWLKRLVLGGMDKVYELGPAFRNEGVDATHNPEFTMCEFYWPFQTLDQLMTTTEDMFHTLFEQLSSLDPSMTSRLPNSIIHRRDADHKPEPFFPKKFNRLPFIPTLEQEMGCPLPDLDLPNSSDLLQMLFKEKSLPVPVQSTIPTLLDALSAAYIEPLCTAPTFITEPPAALSPLAKSFRCLTTGHLVSARAELFVAGAEYANMYEEENSPFEQRRKLEAQLAYRRQVDPDAVAEMDESYLEALEWGLPPTGGWGLGVDRLVMLFTGRKRIGDVLPFGTLRNVVGLQKAWRK